VLKDASAAAIYGSRAANGVVLITTKKGTKGQKAQIDFGYFTGVQEVFELDQMLNREQYIEMHQQARGNAGLPLRDPGFFGEADTDWQDQIFRQAAVSQYDLSVRGGNESTTYYASFGITEQEGTLKGSGFERYSGRLNLNSEVSDKLSFGTNLAFSYTNSQVQSNDNFIIGPYYTALRARPDLAVFDEDGGFASANTPDNPLAATTYENNVATYRFLGTAFGEYSILPELKIKSSISLDYTLLQQDQYWPTTTLGGILNGNGYAQQGYRQQRNYIWENTLSYEKSFGDHNLNALLGASWQDNRRKYIIASATDFPNDQLNNFISAATPLLVDGNGNSNGLTSFYSRVAYDYQGKYLATFTARADGSSRFAENNQYGFFPSLGLGWRLSEENFLSDAPWLDELKVRASAGLTGNQEFGDFEWRGLFGSANALYAGSGGLIPSQIANNDLQWETTRQVDVGLDFSLFNARLSGSLGYYLKNTDDLLLNAPVPRNSGFTSVATNIGAVENRGFEIELLGEVVRTENFNWEVGINATRNTNEVIRLVNGEDIQAAGFGQSIIREGEPLGAFFGFVADGIIRSQEQLDALNTAAPDGVYQTAGTAPGDLLFADINGDNEITDADQTVIGSAQPDWFGGISSNMSYKGISLTAFFQYSYGNDIVRLNRRDIINFHNASNRSAEVLNAWTPDNSDSDLPRNVWGDPNQNRRNSSFYVEDGSFLRLKQLRVSYSLPSSLLSKTPLRTVRVFAQGTNLFTITNYSGVDPEISTFNDDAGGNDTNTAFGVDNNTYPGGQTYTMGINIGL